MNNIKETITAIMGILLSAIIAWFTPDVFNSLSLLLSLDKIEIAPLTRFLSAGFGAAIGFVVSGHLSQKRNFDTAILNLRLSIKSEVTSSLETAIDKSVVPLLLDIKSNDPRNLHQISILLGPLIRYFAVKGYGMNTANHVIAMEQIKELQKQLDLLNSEGLTVNLDLHLKTTQNLVEKCSEQYVQIHRHVLDVSIDWSSDWIRFLEQLSKRDIRRTYILLISEKELEDKKTLIENMNKKIRNYNFAFKICTIESLKTTYGQVDLLKYDAIEVFDETVIKTQQFVDGKYIEGSKIKMKILNYTDTALDIGIIKNIVTNCKSYNQ